MKRLGVLFYILVLSLCFIVFSGYYEHKNNVTIFDDKVALGDTLYDIDKNSTDNSKRFLSGSVSTDNKVYYVDTATMLTLSQSKNITGSGYIRWDGWKALSKESILSGNLKVEYINDDVYTSMKTPSEVQTFMSFRVNPSIISYKPEGHVNVLGMGAIYSVPNAELPESFDVYIGKMKTFALMAGDEQWHVIDEHDSLNSTKYFGFYMLPWTTHISYKVPEAIMEKGEGYVKFNLTKANLTNQVLHFWGSKQPCKSEDIIGLVTIYEIWSDTPDITGKLAATIGIDHRTSAGVVQQAFSGRNYAVTNSKRLVIGHNMPDDVYDWCVANGKSPQVCLDLFYQD